MKRFLRILLLQVLLISCADVTAPATPTVEATPSAVPTSTPAPFAPTLPELIEPRVNGTADTPPEFTTGFGGEVKGISQADIDYLVAWEVYQKLYRPEQGPTTWTEQEFLEKFVPEMLAYLDKKSAVELIVQQDEGTGKLLVALVQKSGDTKSVYWDYDGEALANTNPMSLDADFSDEPGFVKLKPGLSPQFRYNALDGHWYLFAVDADGEAVEWLATNGATRENVDERWKEVPKEPELFTLGYSPAMNERMRQLDIPENYTPLLYEDGTPVPMGLVDIDENGERYVFSGVLTEVMVLDDYDSIFNEEARGAILNMRLPNGNEVRVCLTIPSINPTYIGKEDLRLPDWKETEGDRITGREAVLEALQDHGVGKQVLFTVYNSTLETEDHQRGFAVLLALIEGKLPDLGVFEDITHVQLSVIVMPPDN